MPTPFGTIYSCNITPDAKTGIGSWTANDFYGTMHTGRFPDGGLIYPAMPFGSYTKVTRQDSDAIFAYLRSVLPVNQPNRPHDLRFPFNNRQLILGWRTLFFQEGEYQPDPTKSAEWNRPVKECGFTPARLSRMYSIRPRVLTRSPPRRGDRRRGNEVVMTVSGEAELDPEVRG